MKTNWKRFLRWLALWPLTRGMKKGDTAAVYDVTVDHDRMSVLNLVVHDDLLYGKVQRLIAGGAHVHDNPPRGVKKPRKAKEGQAE